jgi:DNA replication protein DnaC
MIIDDFGLKPLRPADEDLHNLVAERYETASTILTSNVDFHAGPPAPQRLLARA